MKLHKQTRFLYRTLTEQTINALAEHIHGPFMIKGSGCMLCRLMDVGFPLAMLQLARENGLNRMWLPAELELADLIGHEKYKKRVKREMLMIQNMPQRICKYCEGKVIIFTHLSQIARHLLASKSTSWYANCQECGHKIIFAKKDIPIKLLTIVRARLAASKKRKKIKLVAHEPQIQPGGNPVSPQANNPNWTTFTTT